MDEMPLLLTPGPLTTAPATRAAMSVDYGSRDARFVALTAELRETVTRLAAPSAPEAFTCVPLQGSGTFSVEAALGTLVPRDGKLLVLVNGAYGRRMVDLATRMGRVVEAVTFDEAEPVDPAAVADALAGDTTISHVAVVHCETTTGLLNPLEDVARAVAQAGRRLLVDAMSAFGAISLDAATLPCDAVMASSNKCLEGVPGMGFVVVRRSALSDCADNAHSVSLDLHAQAARFEKDGQWRFTPPTHVIAAFVEALRAHAEEGGTEGRGARYRRNCATLVDGMRRLGFRTLLPDALQAPIIVTFLDPEGPSYRFADFYAALDRAGFSIYPGKLTAVPTFRVGCIGQVQPADLQRFVETVAHTLEDLGVQP